jgi:hypothetical protein
MAEFDITTLMAAQNGGFVASFTSQRGGSVQPEVAVSTLCPFLIIDLSIIIKVLIIKRPLRSQVE